MNIETYASLPVSSRMVFNKYHPGIEDVETLIAEVNEAEGEYDQQMRPVNRHLEEIERVKGEIQQSGMSRGLVTTIRQIVEKDDALEDKGYSLESFTTFPSRVGVEVSLEELNGKTKDILMGGALVLGIGIILKIIHMIYKFFQKRKTSSKETEQKQKEVAEKIQKVREAEEEIKKMSGETEKLSEAIMEYKDRVKEQRNQFNESMAGTWTKLLATAIIRDEYSEPLQKVFNNFKEYEAKIRDSLQICQQLNAELGVWLEDRQEGKLTEEALTKKISDLIEPVYSNVPAKQEGERKNIQLAIERCEAMRELSKELAPLTEEVVSRFTDNIENASHLVFLDTLRGWVGIDNSDLLSTKYLDTTEKTMKNLNETIARHKTSEPKLTTEQVKLLDNFTRYLSEVYRGFIKVTGICELLSVQYDRFLSAYDKELRLSERTIVGFLKKFGKESLQKRKFNSSLLTSLRDKVLKGEIKLGEDK